MDPLTDILPMGQDTLFRDGCECIFKCFRTGGVELASDLKMLDVPAFKSQMPG